MGIELHHIRGFLAVAEERSFTRAAFKLNIAQPTLSRTVRMLEEHAGVRLLNRTTRSVELSEQGAQLYEDLSLLLPRLDAALRLEGPRTGPRLVFAWGLPGTWAQHAAVRFEEAAGVGVDFVRRDDPMAALGRGEADVALVWGEVSGAGLSVVTLVRDERVAAVGRGTEWARWSSISWHTAAELPFVFNTVSDATPPEAWPLRHRPRVGVEVGNLDEALESVAAGRGVAVLPRAAADRHPHPGVSYVPMVDAPSVPLQLVHRSRDAHPLTPRLLRAARDAAAAAEIVHALTA